MLNKKRRRIGYLQWLASSEGPREAVYLKRFTPSRALLGALRVRHAFSKSPPRCREADHLFLVPPASVKARAIRRYARAYGISTFVETGTFLGDMVEAVTESFARCITIELSEHLWRDARARFQELDTVTCLHGDSATVLPTVLSKIDGRALFWLDAHRSGGLTADGGHDPLHDELCQIFSHRERGHVILIDDARGHDIARISHLAPADRRVSVRNDIVRIEPAHI
jgi:hypothetical protein